MSDLIARGRGGRFPLPPIRGEVDDGPVPVPGSVSNSEKRNRPPALIREHYAASNRVYAGKQK